VSSPFDNKLSSPQLPQPCRLIFLRSVRKDYFRIVTKISDLLSYSRIEVLKKVLTEKVIQKKSLQVPPSQGHMPPLEEASFTSLSSIILAEDVASAATYCAKYYKERLIGRGAYGEAWLVRQTKDPNAQCYIATILNLPAMTARKKQDAYSEIKCLASCHHPNIIRYVEDYDDGEVLLIIMEFAESGDLDKNIKQRAAEKRSFQEIEVLLMFLQLCLALDHIHRGRMMHRDIKTANVMLTSSGLVKIADFGFSRQYEDTVSGALGNT